MAASGNRKEAREGSNFAEASRSKTTPTANHPLGGVVPSLVSSTEPSLHVVTPITPITPVSPITPRVVTPRPHLFSSLEEAHSQITSRSREGSRQVSGETNNSCIGDDSFLLSLSPTDAQALYTSVGFPITHAFGRSLTDSMPSQLPPQLPRSGGAQELDNNHLNFAQALTSQLSSKTEPVVRPSADRQYLEARAFAEAEISNQPPPYNSDSTVDRLIRQYGSSAQASSAAESQTAGYKCLDDSDCFIGQYDGGIEPDAQRDRFAHNELGLPLSSDKAMTTGRNMQDVQAPPNSAVDSSPEREADRLNIAQHNHKVTAGSQVVPDMPLPRGRRTPFPRSNPFAATLAQSGTVEPVPESNASLRPRVSKSPRPLLYWSDSEEDCARIGSDLGVDSEAENRLSMLQPPPERMHSARKHERGRRSFAKNAHKSASGTTAGESDSDDPFKYDGIFPHPSKEREVSACLHQVSGLDQDSSAISYSPESTPLKHTPRCLDGEAASPTTQRLCNTRTTSMAPIGNFGQNAREQRQRPTNSGHEFFDTTAINPEWALGSPDAVRVPVGRDYSSEQERTQARAHPGGQEASQQLILEGLRRDEGHNHRKTGNTDD